MILSENVIYTKCIDFNLKEVKSQWGNVLHFFTLLLKLFMLCNLYLCYLKKYISV